MTACVLSVGGFMLAEWLRSWAKKMLLSVAVFVGIVVGMAGLGMATGTGDGRNNWSALVLWFTAGALTALLASLLRPVIKSRRDRPKDGAPAPLTLS
ncbi:MAG: hypothetical protein LBS27_09750 [Bifidobacteriaceae bacterium]|nr:hypothetical protein [Bifidobacteriaceae bacterium]